jgi:hypothetical protein
MDLKPDESGDAQSGAADPPDAVLDRPLTEMSVDELMALKAAHEARGNRIYNSLPWEVMPLSVAVVVYSKTFLETLAQHNAEALIGAVRTRFRKNDKGVELLVGTEDGTAATVVITDKTPDEARLALLDLDVTAEALRGKILRWDETAMVWRADNA